MNEIRVWNMGRSTWRENCVTATLVVTDPPGTVKFG